jgi:small subunit ribosomal protein S20
MPITSSAKKALRVSKSRFGINQRVRSRMRTAIKQFQDNPSLENLSEAFRRIDRAAKGKVIHTNTAARRKANLSKKLSSAAK